MMRLFLAVAVMLALGQQASAECYADYKAKQDDPLRLHYGVAQVSDAACGAGPGSAEGELAPRLNAMVSRETCAVVGASLGLAQYLIVDRSERATGGPEKPSLLANAVEAVIGAIYQDGGLDKSRKFILRVWKKLLQATPELGRDPKSALQEWAQGSGHPAPVYRHISREGPDHAPVFTVTVNVPGYEAIPGVGSSKQLAEREAARAMLAAIGVEA